jgi:hypothetical protein
MFSYTNRKGDAYYIHKTTNAKGRQRFTMRRSREGAMEQLPEGMEVAENVNGRVSIRKARKRQILPLEERLVTQLLGEHDRQDYRVEVKGRDIIIQEPNTGMAEIEEMVGRFDSLAILESLVPDAEEPLAREFGADAVERYRGEARDQMRLTLCKAVQYRPALRMRLADATKRLFIVAPKGPFGDDEWWDLPGALPLAEACNRYIRRLGTDEMLEEL